VGFPWPGNFFPSTQFAIEKWQVGPSGKMHDCEAGRLLLVFFQEDNGCVFAVCSEFRDFAQRELVAIAVGGARDVGGCLGRGCRGGGLLCGELSLVRL
jgi:hypothetical protein